MGVQLTTQITAKGLREFVRKSLTALATFKWDASQHPREPAGSAIGGRFARRGMGGESLEGAVSHSFPLIPRPAQTTAENLATSGSISAEQAERIKKLEGEVFALGMDIDPFKEEPESDAEGKNTGRMRPKHTPDSWEKTLTIARDELTRLRDEFGIDLTRPGGAKAHFALSASLPHSNAGGETLTIPMGRPTLVQGPGGTFGLRATGVGEVIHLSNDLDTLDHEIENVGKNQIRHVKDDGDIECAPWTVAHQLQKRPVTRDDMLREIFRHEVGHALSDNSGAMHYISQHWFSKDKGASANEPINKEIGETMKTIWLVKNLSTYASSSAEEANAEIFAKFTQQGYQKGTMPKHFEELAKYMIKHIRTPKPRVRKYAEALHGWLFNIPDYEVPAGNVWSPDPPEPPTSRKADDYGEVLKFDAALHPRMPGGHGRQSGRFVPRGHDVAEMTIDLPSGTQKDLPLVGGEERPGYHGAKPAPPEIKPPPLITGHSGHGWGENRGSILDFDNRFEGDVVVANDMPREQREALHKTLVDMSREIEEGEAGSDDWDERSVASNALFYAANALDPHYTNDPDRQHSFLAVGKDGVMRGGAIVQLTRDGTMAELKYLGSFQRGAGSTLLREVEKWAIAQGASHLGLISSDYARPFYAHEGFHIPHGHDPHRTRVWDFVKRLERGVEKADMAAMLRTPAGEYEEMVGNLCVAKDFHERAMALKQSVQKFDESQHPRGQTVPGTNTGSFAPAGESGAMEAMAKLGMGERRDAFKALTRQQQDDMASPRTTIPDRVQELLGDDIEFKDLASYLDHYKDILPDDNRANMEKFMDRLKADALAAGVSEADASELQHQMTRLVLAQDHEAAYRTLGDHGTFHLNGDVEMADDILRVLPQNVNTPENRLLMSLAGAVHDIGYLTPPSRVFLDSGHPRWSQQFYAAHLAPQIEKLLGKDFSLQLSNLIQAHDATIIDFDQRPEQSAFSIADNFALFHHEKMPPMLRHVKENIGTLLRLAGSLDGKKAGTPEHDEILNAAKEEMRSNIDKHAKSLSPELRKAYRAAVDEVSGFLPKYTLGMVGTAYKGVAWNKGENALEIHVERHKANEDLGKLVDFNAAQFHKLAEAYKASGEELLKTGMVRLYDQFKKKVVGIVRVRIRKGEFLLLLKQLWHWGEG